MTDWVLFWGLVLSVLGPYLALAAIIGIAQRRESTAPVPHDSGAST